MPKSSKLKPDEKAERIVESLSHYYDVAMLDRVATKLLEKVRAAAKLKIASD